MVGVRGRRVGVLGLPQPKDLLRICSKSQSCIVPAPGETGRRCPGIVLINTASLSVPRQLLLWGERVLGGGKGVWYMGSVVRAGGRGHAEVFAGRRETLWCICQYPGQVPARGGSMDLQPGKLRLSKDGVHSTADDSEGEGTRKATPLPCRTS